MTASWHKHGCAARAAAAEIATALRKRRREEEEEEEEEESKKKTWCEGKKRRAASSTSPRRESDMAPGSRRPPRSTPSTLANELAGERTRFKTSMTISGPVCPPCRTSRHGRNSPNHDLCFQGRRGGSELCADDPAKTAGSANAARKWRKRDTCVQCATAADLARAHKTSYRVVGGMPGRHGKRG